MFGLPFFWETYGAMEYSVTSGKPAAVIPYPEGLWAYLEQRPEEARVFNAAMMGKAQGAVAGILAAYDFSPYGTIADIGGGNGHLLRAILEAVPDATGVLFELPHVIDAVPGGAPERLTLQAGDFFRDALPRCEAYVLMEILHDWDDAASRSILEAVRRAAPPHARLLVLETIVPDEPVPDWSRMLDIHMLTLLGGRQRSRPEYAALLEATGFRLVQEIDTHAGISILEAETV
jgi:hypothetical protein